MADDSWGDCDVSATPAHLAGIDVWVMDNTGTRSGACYKCGEEGHRSQECRNNPGVGGGGRLACYMCGEEGHMSRECPRKTCFKCGEEGHLGRECPNNADGSGGGRRACYRCGEDGHLSRECPNNPESRIKTCFTCREEGHVSRDCRKPACYKCGEEGHRSRDCLNPNNLVRSQACFLENNNVPHQFASASGSTVNPPPPSQPTTSRLATGSRLPLRNTSITTPPIHENGSSKTVPFPSSWNNDIICCIGPKAENGTYTYLIPILTALLRKKKNVLEPQSTTTTTTAPHIRMSPEVVILVPDNQTVGRITENIRTIVTGNIGGNKHSLDHFYSVVPVGETGCKILVTVISGIGYLQNEKNLDLKNVKFLVLEEATELLLNYSVEAAELLVSNFSAKEQRTSVAIYNYTWWYPEKDDVLKVFLKDDPMILSFGFHWTRDAVNVCQGITLVESQEEGLEKMVEYLKRRHQEDASVLIPIHNKTLIFCESTIKAYYLASQLSFRKIDCLAIHEELHEWQKEQVRMEFIVQEKQRILIVSRESAIGLRITKALPKVGLVINFNLPISIQEYVHRIGMIGVEGAPDGSQFTIFVRERQEGEGCRRCRGRDFDECYSSTH